MRRRGRGRLGRAVTEIPFVGMRCATEVVAGGCERERDVLRCRARTVECRAAGGRAIEGDRHIEARLHFSATAAAAAATAATTTTARTLGDRDIAEEIDRLRRIGHVNDDRERTDV